VADGETYQTIAKDLVVAYLSRVTPPEESDPLKAGDWIGHLYMATLAKVLAALHPPKK